MPPYPPVSKMLWEASLAMIHKIRTIQHVEGNYMETCFLMQSKKLNAKAEEKCPCVFIGSPRPCDVL